MSDTIEVWDGAEYLQFGGVPGPTTFVRLGDERLTPRAAGDLIVDPNVAAVDWETGWVYPVFQNGWENYGSPFAPARYRKAAGGLVVVEGLIKGGTMNATAFQLASGYRTPYWIIFTTINTDSYNPNRTQIIGGTGQVNPVYGTNGYCSIHCQFFAEI